MSFNRVNYDSCAYNLKIGRSVSEGDYRLFAPFAENCNQCYTFDGPVGSKSDVSLARKMDDLSFKNLAEVESELSWRRQLLTKCNDDELPFDKFTLNHKPECNKKLTPEDTRFTHPLDDFRSMSLTSYMVSPYLHVNPQCAIISTCDLVGLNSRMQAKDTYSTPTMEAWDNGESLPTEKLSSSAKNFCNK